ncbi:MAG TPA: efflux RND transporter periplasmic adaptor subunit [Pirellulales bacterium]|nr:efflux RND transporter periplasmic adaptor subunit [Pirellulales bacterium]
MKYLGVAPMFLLAAAVAGSAVCAASGAAPSTIRALGTVQPNTVVDISAQVSGRIGKIQNVAVGQRVQKGKLLAEVDSGTYEAAVTMATARIHSAEADLGLAKTNASRAQQELQHWNKQAGDQGSDSLDVKSAKSKLEAAQAQVQSDMATLEKCKTDLTVAKANLELCRITSPIDGVIIDSHIKLGQSVKPGGDPPALLTMIDDSKVSIWASVNEADVGNVKVGMPAQFSFDALPGKTFSGRVSQIRLNAAALQNQVVYTVVIPVDQKDPQWLPYMTANVEINPGEQK